MYSSKKSNQALQKSCLTVLTSDGNTRSIQLTDKKKSGEFAET